MFNIVEYFTVIGEIMSLTQILKHSTKSREVMEKRLKVFKGIKILIYEMMKEEIDETLKTEELLRKINEN